MSRSGYSDDCDDNWQWIRWRGTVASAIRGKRGQAFLKEMLAAMDAMPEKRLIAKVLESNGAITNVFSNAHLDYVKVNDDEADFYGGEDRGGVCAIGTVGRVRNIDMTNIDPDDYSTVAGKFGIADALAREIVFMNDDAFYAETPEGRFVRMRKWIESQIKTDSPERSTETIVREHRGA